MEGRARRTKASKTHLEGIKEARQGGVSRLDQLNFDEDDDVYDVVDEEKYEEIVENRRKQGDFVVDDDGLGYYDNGEEVLGVGEDNFDVRKRLKEAAKLEDMKTTKKARKLMEDMSGQSGSILKHMTMGVGSKPKPKEAAPQAALDIDELLNDKSEGGQRTKAIPSQAFSRPPIRRPVASVPFLFSYETATQPLQEDISMQGDDDQGFNGSSVEAQVPSTPSAVGVEPTPSPSSVVPSTHEVVKMSLTKSTKSLKMAAALAAKPHEDKPLLSAPQASVPNFQDDEPSVSSNVSNIDPKSWMLERPSATDGGAASYVRMFWTDATEANGVIYLFGRVPVTSPDGKQTRHLSACAVVQGCMRNLFVLPRAQDGKFREENGVQIQARHKISDVYSEVSQMLTQSHIIPKQQGATFSCKPVKRRYAFEYENIPREETEYLKVVYSAKYGIPSQKQCQEGGASYEHIFGAGLSPLELFLLKRKLTGPCWIEIKAPRPNADSISWCKLEFTVDNPKFVAKLNVNETPVAPPNASAMSISMKTVVNPSTHMHEIVSLTALVHHKVDMDGETELNTAFMKRFTFVRQLGVSCGNAFPATFPHNMAELSRHRKDIALECCLNERMMLSLFLTKLQQEDPDIIVSHNLLGFELDLLLSRMLANKLANWSVLGRLRKSKPPSKTSNFANELSGRIMCDTYKAAKEFLRETTYSLTALAASQLKAERAEVDPIDVPRYFSSAQDIVALAGHTFRDAWLVQGLMLKLQVVPLTKQLTNLSGNLWSRTVKGARAERIEYLLLHEFHHSKFILPERKLMFQDNKAKARAMDDDDENLQEAVGKVGGMSRKRAKAAYAGGLVLEPKKGLYDTYILLLDFNSLYPSIIQEYNLCFTTINWPKFMQPAAGEVKEEPRGDKAGKKTVKVKSEEGGESGEESEGGDDPAADGVVSSLPPIPDAKLSTGILPRVIKTLVDRRRAVKNLLKNEKDPVQRQQLDIRQKALKLTANSMYGCLGFSFSRFYARPIAALVTAMGREALQRTVDLATQAMKLDVIYGDTDSVMINTNSLDLQEVKEIGNKVKREVNKFYKSLELDLDGIFRSMLLLKKKKYAALVVHELGNGQVEYEKEMKGLDLVRRDWCPLSKDTGKFVVDQILSGNSREDIVTAILNHLSDLAAKIRGGEVPMEAFVITKGLNKNPKDYPDCNGQAHLQVALQMLKASKPVNIGDHIPYIICTQTSAAAEGSSSNNSNSVAHRAYHPDDVVRSNGELTIDLEWYLSTQILPPVSRLCEPIEGASPAVLSLKLGLDASKFTRAPAGDELLDDAWGFTPQCQLDDAERFRGCQPLLVKCSACRQESSMKSVMDLQEGGGGSLSCSHCGALFFGRMQASDCYCYLSNRVTLLVRECVRRYYDCWLECDEQSCGLKTMQQSVRGLACTAEGCHGRMRQVYDELALHAELKYLESLFDVKRFQSRKAVSDKMLQQMLPMDQQEVLRLLSEHMANTVKGSAYNWIRPSLWTALFGKLSSVSTGKSFM